MLELQKIASYQYNSFPEALADLVNNVFMFRDTFFSQFGHSAQHEYFIFTRYFAEIFYGQLHTAGICIVSVEDNFISSFLDQLGPAVGREIIFNSRPDL